MLIKPGGVAVCVAELQIVKLQRSQGNIDYLGLAAFLPKASGSLQHSGIGFQLFQAEQDLASPAFFRCSQGYLVNLEHVDGIRGEDALVHGERVQVSRSRKRAFLDALNDYLSEEGG